MGGPCFERLRSGEERKLVELDNFYPAPFILDGECWPTAEHYFQAAKFPSAPALQAQIRMARQCTGAEGCYILGNSRSGQLREDWDEVKLSCMYLSLIHISEPTRRTPISYAVFCLKKKKK